MKNYTPELRDNIICLGSSDHGEREGYTVSLQTGNYENDLHAAQDELPHVDDHGAFMTGSVYTDVNEERRDPDGRFMQTLRRVMAGNPCTPNNSAPGADDARDQCRPGRGNIPTISYAIRGQSAPTNSWEDPHYFTAVFPTLFPTGTGGSPRREDSASIAYGFRSGP